MLSNISLLGFWKFYQESIFLHSSGKASLYISKDQFGLPVLVTNAYNDNQVCGILLLQMKGQGSVSRQLREIK